MNTFPNINLEKYFERINYQSSPRADLSTLKQLHRLHLLNIPFENLDIHFSKNIILSFEEIEKKIVNDNRGGFCYEMNGLFYAALKRLGFNVQMVSARVYENGAFGKEFDHLALLVTLDETYLADVGFGNNFIEPIKFIPLLEQNDESGIYMIAQPNEKEFLLNLKNENGELAPQYIFTTKERSLNDFVEMCNYHQTSPESHFTQKKVCTKLTPSGRITLTDNKFIETMRGEKNIYEFSDEKEFHFLLQSKFGIEMIR